MKALICKTRRAAVTLVLALIACFLCMGTSHATQRYLLDICGTVTVNGEPASDVLVVAWWCTNETEAFTTTVSDGSVSNNYHLLDELYFGPSDEYGTYTPEVFLTFHYGDCMVEVSCDEVDDADGKVAIDVDILCVSDGGEARTPGFWQGGKGFRLVGDDDIAMLNECCLRNQDGSDADFANKQKFRAWLKKRNAKNMAYQLSGHLAAMKLNIFEGYVDVGDMIYAPGCSESEGEYISIGSVVELADEALCEDGLTNESGDARDYQECLKNALDDANNNLNWVEL